MATPLPPPPSTINCTTGTLKNVYLFISYMPYSRISQDKQVFNLAKKFKGISNQISIALINFWKFKNFNHMVVVC